MADPGGPAGKDLGDGRPATAGARGLHLEHRDLAVGAGPHHQAGERGGRRRRWRAPPRPGPDVTPAGTSTTTGSAMKASFRTRRRRWLAEAALTGRHGRAGGADTPAAEPSASSTAGDRPLRTTTVAARWATASTSAWVPGQRGWPRTAAAAANCVELELVDAAVAPDLLLGRRQRAGAGGGRRGPAPAARRARRARRRRRVVKVLSVGPSQLAGRCGRAVRMSA